MAYLDERRHEIFMTERNPLYRKRQLRVMAVLKFPGRVFKAIGDAFAYCWFFIRTI